MKRRLLTYAGMFLVLAVLTNDAFAQPRRGRRRPAADTTGAAGAATEQVNTTRPPGGFSVYGNLPITVDSSEGSDTAVRRSLRNDNAFERPSSNDRTPLPYEHLRWDDALFAEKVWRELDLREKINQTFRYAAEDDDGNQMFINILLRAVNSGQVTAFADERFTKPMTVAEIQQLTGGSADTTEVRDVNDPNKVVGLKVVRASFDAKSVTKMRIKEEWVFDREASRLFVRILGICPLKSREVVSGGPRRGGAEAAEASSPMFWVYYPDLRPVLAKHFVYNPKNMGAHRMSWEELFEARMFSSYIIKSTLDNPGNKMIRQVVKDPILQLVEGENVKERIFNYEQDLWSY